MKQILSFLLFLLPVLVFAQWPAAPNKIRLGNQTTGDGLIARTDSIPDWTPADRNNAWLAFDTVANLLYFYEGGTWQEYASGGGGGVQYSDSLTTFVTPTQLSDSLSTVVAGSGTLNTIPKWTPDGTTLGNSLITDDGARVSVGGTAGLVLPSGTTAQRSGAPVAGEMRKNITTNLPEIYTNSEWRDFQLANFQSSLVPYATSNGQLGADTFVYRSGEGMFFRRVSTSGENAAITVARVNNAFPNNSTNPLQIGYSGGDAYYIGNLTTNRITFLSNGRIQIGGPIQRASGGNSMISSNGRPGHFFSEINDDTGTRIFKHIFGEATLGNTVNNISPFIVTLPSRQTLSSLNAHNSIISGAIFRQTITADSSTVSPITLQALDLNPSYQSNGYQANAYGLRYRPSSLSSVINHYAITTTSGKVGFGTETPSNDLHVVGTARVTGSSTLPAASVTGRDSLGVFRDVTIGSGLSFTGGTLSATGPAANLGFTGPDTVIELDAGGTPVFIAEGSGVDVTQSGDTLTITGKGTRFVQDSITGATLTVDLNEAPTAIISLKMTSATSVTLTISNPYGFLTDATAPTYEGETGVYTFRFWGISGTDNVTWPANFYDMNGTALGTDALTAGTAYTCYYDPIANEYYCK